MAAKSQKTDADVTARDFIIDHELRGGRASSQKLGFQTEALLLLCEKVGITEKDLKELSVKSARRCEEAAKKFEADLTKARPDAEELIAELSLRTKGHSGPHLLGGELKKMCFRVDRDDPLRRVSIKAEGQGDWPLVTTNFRKTSAAYLFQFTPLEQGIYTLTAPFLAAGPYWVIADSGPCKDKHARLGVTVETRVSTVNFGAQQVVFAASKDLFAAREEDGAVHGEVLIAETIEAPGIPLNAGSPTYVVISFFVAAEASGGGASAYADFSQKGAVSCPCLDVCRPLL